jgi:hypothetical protein
MLSYGLHSFEKLKDLKWADIDVQKYRQRKVEMINEYKALLLKNINNEQ